MGIFKQSRGGWRAADHDGDPMVQVTVAATGACDRGHTVRASVALNVPEGTSGRSGRSATCNCGAPASLTGSY